MHSAGKEINEKNVKAVLKGAGADVDDGRVKALIASLDGIDKLDISILLEVKKIGLRVPIKGEIKLRMN